MNVNFAPVFETEPRTPQGVKSAYEVAGFIVKEFIKQNCRFEERIQPVFARL